MAQSPRPAVRGAPAHAAVSAWLLLTFTVAALALAPSAPAAAKRLGAYSATGIPTASTAHGDDADILVGIHYFGGWWTGPGNKWIEPWNKGVDWRPLFPRRVPLTGEYNVQATMDAEIAAAAAHNVSYFNMLYYDNLPSEREPGSINLNRAIAEFPKSPNAHLMRFHISWCNSLPLYGVHSDAEWAEMIQRDWLPAFRSPSYLRVGGALVFKLINAGDFLLNCNRSVALVESRLATLRRMVQEAGLGPMIIGAGAGCEGLITDPSYFGGAQYNWTGLYGCVPNPQDGFQPFQVYPWAALSNFTHTWRRKWLNLAPPALPHVPLVMSGWDPRPWNETRPSFVFPTTQEWLSELQAVKADILEHAAGSGFPLPGGGVQHAFTIYSWNEFGEGGIMAPSAGWKYQRLQGVRSVFGG